MTLERHFRTAARAYLGYGVVYWLGGVWLLLNGVGVTGTAATSPGVLVSAWAVIGLFLVVAIPYLLRRPRPWFERWILSRRDFARLLALFLAVRAWKVAEVALHSHGGAVPAPWGGVVTFQMGAVVFFVVTMVALVFVVVAAWAEPSG
jgi:hypothetical protein